MLFEYYYGKESEQFTFIRIPQVFFTGQAFIRLSCEAKILYGLMLNRMSLSQKNNWIDSENRVFIIYPIEEVMEILFCAKAKAVKIVKELEDFGLIEKNRQGFGKPTIIFVKNFIKQRDITNTNSSEFEDRISKSFKSELAEVQKSNLLKFENQTSGGLKNELVEVQETNSNNIHNNNIDFSNIKKEKEVEHFFEKIWEAFPNKKGKAQVTKEQKEILYTIGEENMLIAIKRYEIELKKEKWRSIQYGSTFFNEGYIDYLDENYVPCRIQNNKNSFHNFEQRNNDYDKLEKMWINKINNLGDKSL